MARLNDRDGYVYIEDNEDGVVAKFDDSGNITLAGDVTVGDDLVVTDDATISGDLAVTGPATITGIFTASSTAVFSGAVNRITDAKNIVLGTTTGTKIGTSASQKLGFFNVTPVVRPAAFTQTYSTTTGTHANVTATAPATTAAVTTASGRYGYASLTQANAITVGLTANIADVLVVKKVLNKIIDDLQALGLLQ